MITAHTRRWFVPLAGSLLLVGIWLPRIVTSSLPSEAFASSQSRSLTKSTFLPFISRQYATTPEPPPPPAGGLITHGDIEALVMRVNLTDALVGCEEAELWASTFATTDSVNAVYSESSRGALWLTGDVATFNIGYSVADGCLFEEWGAAADAAATAAGYDVAAYDKLIYVMPDDVLQGTCPMFGTAGSDRIRVWTNLCQVPRIMAHELGHTFGWYHASTADSELGDRSDPMGGGWNGPLAQFNAPHLALAGWLTGTAVLDIGTPGTYAMDATELDTAVAEHPQILRLAKPDTDEYYYVSFRNAIDLDANLEPLYRDDVVSVHLFRGFSFAPGYPPPNTYLVALLHNGESFQDAANGITISMTGYNGHVATVQIVPSTSTPPPPTSTPIPPGTWTPTPLPTLTPLPLTGPLYGYSSYRKLTSLPLAELAQYTNFIYTYHRVGAGWPDDADLQALRQAGIHALLKLDSQVTENQFDEAALRALKARIDPYRDVILGLSVIDEPYRPNRTPPLTEQELEALVGQVKAIFPDYIMHVNFLAPYYVEWVTKKPFPIVPDNIDLISTDVYIHWGETAGDEDYLMRVGRNLAIILDRAHGRPVFYVADAYGMVNEPATWPSPHEAQLDHQLYLEQGLEGLAWYLYDEGSAGGDAWGAAHWPDLLTAHREIGASMLAR